MRARLYIFGVVDAEATITVVMRGETMPKKKTVQRDIAHSNSCKLLVEAVVTKKKTRVTMKIRKNIMNAETVCPIRDDSTRKPQYSSKKQTYILIRYVLPNRKISWHVENMLGLGGSIGSQGVSSIITRNIYAQILYTRHKRFARRY